jgi:DNA-binding transcriptional MerR regulator
MATSTVTVSTLARQVGVGPDTIRYYERVGPLPTPTRTPAGYRRYDDDIADRVRFIKGAQRLGLRLREIAELLQVRDRGGCPLRAHAGAGRAAHRRAGPPGRTTRRPGPPGGWLRGWPAGGRGVAL